MSSHPLTRQEYARKAATERLWTHTIGISNRALARTGIDPSSGLRGTEWSIPGSGFAGLWGQHHIIITAAHVVENATVSDLELFARPTTSLREAPKSEVTVQDAFPAVSLGSGSASIHCCKWEDLALITLSSDSLGPYLEFADIAKSWVDPEEGNLIIGLGYPVGGGVIREIQRSPHHVEKFVLLNPQIFSGDVLPAETGRSFKNFDQNSHFLMPFEPASKGIDPGGISGAAAWVQSPEEQLVWTPRFDFAGIYTRSYREGTIVQAVKASVVRRFLVEVLGEAVSPAN